MTNIHALAAPFRTPSAEDWRRTVEKALQAASFDDLRSSTREGIPLEPIYPQARDAPPLFARPGEGRWRLVQRLDHPDPAEANGQARREMERGVNGLALVPLGAPSADGFGLALSARTVEQVLDGIDLHDLHLRLEPHSGGPETVSLLAKFLDQRGSDAAKCDVAFGLDPIGVAAREGGFSSDWADVRSTHAEAAEARAAGGLRGTVLEADGRVYAGAGADAVQELAYVLASAAEYLRLLDHAGTPPERAFPLIGMTLTVDADQLVSIAKLRAARLLWARLQEVCGAAASRLRLHAETARLMMMRADAHANLLRTTIAAFAAGVGGVDSLTVLPFNIALGLPDAFARRLARNTQLLLMEETHLHRVADPAAGCGAVEALTETLSRRAWEGFQQIEREGGMVESLAAGRIQARIGEQRLALVEAYAAGEASLVGVTHYVDEAPVPVSVSELPPLPERPRTRPAFAFEPLELFDLEGQVSRVPENAP